MMLTYADALALVKGHLPDPFTGRKTPRFDPGPPTIKSLTNLSPGAQVYLTVGNGIGPTTEDTFDRPFIVVRVLGPQNDYAAAEGLAHAIDRLFLGLTSQALASGTRLLYITRAAPPQVVDFDSADRYHFQTTYITEVQR